MRDIKNYRELRKYTQKILRIFKDIGFTNTRNQLNLIYNNLNAKLKRNIKKLRENIKLNKFLEDLDNLKYN